MTSAGMIKRRIVTVLGTVALSAGAILGITGTADAATGFMEYGWGGTPSASVQDAESNAAGACDPAGYQVEQGTMKTYWNGTEYETQMAVYCIQVA
jgi:hypothetical protein